MSSRAFYGDYGQCVFLTDDGVFISGTNVFAELELQIDVNLENRIRKMTTLEREEIVSVGFCQYSINFLTKDGRVLTYEADYMGFWQLKNENKAKIVFSSSRQRIQNIACGADFTIALTTHGKLFGWGTNKNGEIGVGHTNSPVTTPIPLETLSSHKICSVACGISFTLALTTKGYLFSWGFNGHGQLGHGSGTKKHTPTLVSSLSHHKVTQIACGSRHSMAVIKEREKTLCFSWGWGSYGQLGHGDEKTLYIPKFIEALKDEKITLIDCGFSHSLAMSRDGKIFTWGDNLHGQLCLGDKKQRFLPTEVKALKEKEIVHCCCCRKHTGFITKERKLFVCGMNTEGQLGIENEENQFYPVEVPLPSKILIPLNITTEMAVRKSAKFVLFILCSEYERLRREYSKRKITCSY